MSGNHESIGCTPLSLGSQTNGDSNVSNSTSSEFSSERTIDIHEDHPHYKDQVNSVIDSAIDANTAQHVQILVGTELESSVEESTTCREMMQYSKCSKYIPPVQICDESSSIVEEYVLHATIGQATLVNAALHESSFHDQSSIPMAQAIFVSNFGEDYPNASNEHFIVQLDEVRGANMGTNFMRTASLRTGTTTQLSGSVSNEPMSESKGNNVVDFEFKMKKITLDAMKTERKFWVRLVVVAILLNTLLVTGIVAAGFCASGNCRTSESLEVDGIMIPSLSPSPYLFSPDNPPEFSTGDNISSTENKTAPDYAAGSTDNNTTPVNDESRNVSIGFFVGIAIASELLIMSILFVYHCMWKRNMARQKMHDISISSNVIGDHDR
jgi:hypothetical protein